MSMLQECKLDGSRDVFQPYGKACDHIMKKTIHRYADFVKKKQRVVNYKRWTPIKSERGIDLYEEKSVAEYAATSDHAPLEMTTLVSVLGGGVLHGTVETILDGLYTDNTDSMERNATIQFGKGVQGCSVVRVFETATDDHPFGFFGVKWLEKSSHIPGATDQLLWLERMGLHPLPSGRRFGFHVVKSVDALGTEGEEDERVRYSCNGSSSVRQVNMSICCLFYQISADTVDVYIRGVAEIPLGSLDRREEAVDAAGDYILAGVRGRECARMRKLTELLEQADSYNDGCRTSDVSKAATLPGDDTGPDDRRDGKEGDYLCFSLSTSNVCASFLAAQQTDYAIAKRRSTTEFPEPSLYNEECLPERTSDTESALESDCMLRTIRDPRPKSCYRQNRKKQDNVLIQMLRRQHGSNFGISWQGCDDDENSNSSEWRQKQRSLSLATTRSTSSSVIRSDRGSSHM